MRNEYRPSLDSLRFESSHANPGCALSDLATESSSTEATRRAHTMPLYLLAPCPSRNLHAVLGRVLLLSFLCGTAIACDDDVVQFVFESRIVDGDGGNPAAGTDATTLGIAIAEGELDVRDFEYPITDGQFDASLEFASFSSPTRIRVGIDGPTTTLFTAPPAFVPSVAGGFMRVVASPPSSCTPVSFIEMLAPRASFGMVQSGTFALVIGGTTASDEQVEFLDALQWDARLFDENILLSFLGETQAATIGEGEILVVPSDASASPFVFNMLDASNRVTSVVLHTGAGGRSAVVAIPGVGAMVIGGEQGGAARAGVTLVQPEGMVTSLSLSEARSGPTAVALGADVLVVGGNDSGNAELLLAGSTVGQPLEGVADGPREGGLMVGDGETQALLLGGVDDDGTVRQDTLRFEGCPVPCEPSEGPTWSAARPNAIVPEGGTLVIGGDGSTLVDEVQFGEGSASIERVVELNTERASAGAIVYESGVFVVGGGDDGDGRRNDFEFCAPASLTPLE